jgi:hypothetical protein
MNDEAYQRRLERDVTRWIEQGMVTSEGGARILASAPAPTPRLSASTALGLAGAGLFGIAAIAFIMANWDGLPRFGRLGLVTLLIAAAIGGAIWADTRRPQTQGALLLVATLVFAAGAGLVGQMYNIPGEPWGVFAAAAVASYALSVISGKAAPGIAGAAFAAFAYGSGWSDDGLIVPGFLVVACAANAVLAVRQRKAPLTHAAIWLAAFTLAALVFRMSPGASAHPMLINVVAWASAAAWGRFATRPGARTLYGYVAIFATIAYWVWGAAGTLGVAHHAGSIVIGLGLVALGRHDRHGWVLAAGIAATIIGIVVVLTDLGLDLMAASGLSLLLALGALIASFALARGRRSSATPGSAA